jgi:hypothetical protein
VIFLTFWHTNMLSAAPPPLTVLRAVLSCRLDTNIIAQVNFYFFFFQTEGKFQLWGWIERGRQTNNNKKKNMSIFFFLLFSMRDVCFSQTRFFFHYYYFLNSISFASIKRRVQNEYREWNRINK